MKPLYPTHHLTLLLIHHLTCRFIVEVGSTKLDCLINLDIAGSMLSVERRRLYDVVNVLETLDVVAKAETNYVLWKGTEHIRCTLQRLQRAAAADSHLAVPAVSAEVAPPNLACSADSESCSVHRPGLCAQDFTDPYGKTIGGLARHFLQAFLVGHSPVDLEVAAKWFMAPEDTAKLKTKLRRLYDIAKAFQTLGLIEKQAAKPGNRPCFVWAWKPSQFPLPVGLGAVDMPPATLAAPLPSPTPAANAQVPDTQATVRSSARVSKRRRSAPKLAGADLILPARVSPTEAATPAAIAAMPVPKAVLRPAAVNVEPQSVGAEPVKKPRMQQQQQQQQQLAVPQLVPERCPASPTPGLTSIVVTGGSSGALSWLLSPQGHSMKFTASPSMIPAVGATVVPGISLGGSRLADIMDTPGATLAHAPPTSTARPGQSLNAGLRNRTPGPSTAYSHRLASTALLTAPRTARTPFARTPALAALTGRTPTAAHWQSPQLGMDAWDASELRSRTWRSECLQGTPQAAWTSRHAASDKPAMTDTGMSNSTVSCASAAPCSEDSSLSKHADMGFSSPMRALNLAGALDAAAM